MAKGKMTTVFFCQNCGYESSKWMGQCPACTHVIETAALEQLLRLADMHADKFRRVGDADPYPAGGLFPDKTAKLLFAAKAAEEKARAEAAAKEAEKK